MSERDSGRGDPAARNERWGRVDRVARRRERIRAELERNRRGEYKVPTWVLVVALVAFVAGWVAVVALA